MKATHSATPFEYHICSTPKKKRYIEISMRHKSAVIAVIPSFRDDGKDATIDEMIEDAKLIVTACNVHSELLANTQANATIVSNAELEAMSKDVLVSLLGRIRNEAINSLNLVKV
jgi:hypothetical protein